MSFGHQSFSMFYAVSGMPAKFRKHLGSKIRVLGKYARPDFSFTVLSFTENIGHRASVYVEEYTLSHAVRAGDAIIAATAVEYHLPLSTANTKHFRPIKKLNLKVFKP